MSAMTVKESQGWLQILNYAGYAIMTGYTPELISLGDLNYSVSCSIR